MIYSFKKYKDIDDFVNDRVKSKVDEKYTIINKCEGASIDGEVCDFNDNCFACLFCALYSNDCLQAFKLYHGSNFITEASESAFKLKPITGPKTKQGLKKHPYMSLENFTSVNETTNIQPWAAGLLGVMSSEKSRVSMEIPIFNTDYDRNGRLDVGVMVKDTLLAIESKNSLGDALKDERFIEQKGKYSEVIKKSTCHFTYLTLFGGKETDLFPPSSEYCTGASGGLSRRFYKMIDENGIQFITANALWCLCCKYLENGELYCWDKIIVDIFSSPERIGLCSAGMIIKNNNGYSLEKV